MHQGFHDSRSGAMAGPRAISSAETPSIASVISEQSASSRNAAQGAAPERVIVEHLWSRAGATGGNRWQTDPARRPLKQAISQPSAAHGNGRGLDGKEGVDGSSPSEGFSLLPAQLSLSFSGLTPSLCSGVQPTSTSVHPASSASRSLIACSRPSRARWP
jgi:hypothetical protein